MDGRAFEVIAREELAKVPPRFKSRIANVAVLIEDLPTPSVAREEGLAEGEVLLGLYRGTPASERGVFYTGVLPDTITLYRLPLLEEADALVARHRASDSAGAVRLAIRETLWHELGHHFGLSENAARAREAAGSNYFGYAQRSGQAPRGRALGAIIRRAMTKPFALTLGVLFVLLGLLGFFGSPLIGANALFSTNGATNWLHLIAGLVILAAGYLAGS